MNGQAILESVPDLPYALELLLKQIPFGRVSTYGDLARALGDYRASRWVGEYLLNHPHPIACPCHRVVRSDGRLGLYQSDDPEDKQQKLTAEGIPCHEGRIDLNRFRFNSFRGEPPLESLRKLQDQLAASVSVAMPSTSISSNPIGAVDVSYAGDTAFAAFVLWDATQQSVSQSFVTAMEISFPYVPTYLAFRELPVLLKILSEARQRGLLPDLLLVDGTGIAHPRRGGIASLLGVLGEVNTIGVTKSHLHGQVDLRSMQPGEWRTLYDPTVTQTTLAVTSSSSDPGQEPSHHPLGFAVHPNTRSAKPLFVSPGHRVSIEFAREIVKLTLLTHRLPEPIYWADRLSRHAARTQINITKSDLANRR